MFEITTEHDALALPVVGRTFRWCGGNVHDKKGWKMNVFGKCPAIGEEVEIKSGPMAGKTFRVEDWARNVMAKRLEWPLDLGNPAVIIFWSTRTELFAESNAEEVEFLRVALSGIYGHVGCSGCILMPEELGTEIWGSDEPETF